MKSLVTLTGATVALIAGSAMAFADLDVSITVGRHRRHRFAIKRL